MPELRENLLDVLETGKVLVHRVLEVTARGLKCEVRTHTKNAYKNKQTNKQTHKQKENKNKNKQKSKHTHTHTHTQHSPPTHPPHTPQHIFYYIPGHLHQKVVRVCAVFKPIFSGHFQIHSRYPLFQALFQLRRVHTSPKIFLWKIL